MTTPEHDERRGGARGLGTKLVLGGAGAAATVVLGVVTREILADYSVDIFRSGIATAPLWLQLMVGALLAVGVVVLVTQRLRMRRPRPDSAAQAGEAVGLVPPAPTNFVGRNAERDALVRQLDSDDGPNVVAVVGRRGVGTSALAVHVAHRVARRFPDGVIYLDLRGVAGEPELSAEAAIRRVMEHVGLVGPRTGRPNDLDEAGERLQAWLRPRRVLLLLNNVDHVEQVRHLQPTGAGCGAVMAGSVALESLPGVHICPLQELPEAAAVELLSAVSGRDIAAERDNRDAAALVNMCGRQPLAIRLLGQLLRDRAWPMNRVVQVMASGLRTSPYPHQPGAESFRQVWDACDVSYRDMSRAHRRLFRLLALVPTIEIGANAAAAVAGLPVDRTTRLLDDLARRGLVESARPGYYRVRQLLAASAHHHNEHDGTTRQLRRAIRRLIRYYALLAERYAEALIPLHGRVNKGRPPDRARVESDVWFASEQELLFRLVTSLAGRVDVRSGGEERQLAALKPWLWRLAVAVCTWYAAERRLDAWQQVCQAILQMPAPRSRWARIFAARRGSASDVAFWANNELGVLHRQRGDTDAALVKLRVAERLARGRPRRGLAQAVTNHGLALIDKWQWSQAKAELPLENDTSPTSASDNRLLGEAERLLHEGLELRAGGDHRGQTISRLGLGIARLHTGDLTTARRDLGHAAQHFDLYGDRGGVAAALNALGLVLARQDDRSGAEEHWNSARLRYEADGDDLGLASVLLNIGADLLRTDPDRATDARDKLTESLTLRAGHRETLGTALTHRHLGDAASLCGDSEAARQHWREAARILDGSPRVA